MLVSCLYFEVFQNRWILWNFDRSLWKLAIFFLFGHYRHIMSELFIIDDRWWIFYRFFFYYSFQRVFYRCNWLMYLTWNYFIINSFIDIFDGCKFTFWPIFWTVRWHKSLSSFDSIISLCLQITLINITISNF